MSTSVLAGGLALASAAAVGEAASPSTGFVLGPWSAYHPGSRAEAVAIGDVTGDSRPDVVLTAVNDAPPGDHAVFVFPQLVDGSLGPPTSWPYGADGYYSGIVLVDLNHDLVDDVVVGHDAGLSVLLADGHGGLQPAAAVPLAPVVAVAATDIDRDQKPDVIAAGGSHLTMLFGDGLGGFRELRPLTLSASDFNDIEIEDLNHDSLPDLATTAAIPPTNLRVYHHDGVGSFYPFPQGYSTDDIAPQGLGVGDIDGDGLHDAVTSFGGNRPTYLQLFAQTPEGVLGEASAISSLDGNGALEVTDVDGDGREDVVVLHDGWMKVGVYLQGPDGLDAETLYPIPYASFYKVQGLAVGDFSSDGCSDVAIADYNSGLVTLRGSGCVSSLVFSDGFESGDIATWSATVTAAADARGAHDQP